MNLTFCFSHYLPADFSVKYAVFIPLSISLDAWINTQPHLSIYFAFDFVTQNRETCNRFEKSDPHHEDVDKNFQDVDKNLWKSDKNFQDVDKNLWKSDKNFQYFDKNLWKSDKNFGNSYRLREKNDRNSGENDR